MKYQINVKNYESEWIEQARSRLERGLPVDDGTLATIGQILLDGIENE